MPNPTNRTSRRRRPTTQPAPTLTAEQATALGRVSRAQRDAREKTDAIDAGSNPADLYAVHRQLHELDQQAAGIRGQVASPALRVQLGS